MSPPEYLQSVIPTPYTILGRRLRPLSIGHILLMQFQELAYVSEEEIKATMDDLIAGVLICSMRFREYQEFLQLEDLGHELKRAGQALDLTELPEKFRLFAEYLDQGTESPEIEIPETVQNNILLGTPWLQSLRICLMAKLHVGPEETFDYPYRQALWDCFSLREAEGKLTINSGQADTPDMLETIETLQKMNKAFIEQLAGIPGKRV